MIKKVIKMSASWGAPCKVYAKAFHEVEKEEKYKGIEFEDVDVEENEDLALKYKVRAVPTTIVLGENDVVLASFSGNVPKKDLEKKLDSLKDA